MLRRSSLFLAVAFVLFHFFPIHHLWALAARDFDLLNPAFASCGTERGRRSGEQHERVLRTAQGVSSARLLAAPSISLLYRIPLIRITPINTQTKIEHREKLNQQNKTASNANGVKVKPAFLI